MILYFGWILFLTAVSFTFFSEKAVIFGSEVVKSTITLNPIFVYLHIIDVVYYVASAMDHYS